jgi:RNA-binding protein
MLSAKQRAELARLAQTLECFASLGKAGLTDALASRLDVLLGDHELVKLRFGDHKDEKCELADELARRTGSELVRFIGNVAVFYRADPDPAKRRIEIGK